MKLSDRTIHRNRNDWEKYYRNKRINTKAVDRITTEDIEVFFYECIREHPEESDAYAVFLLFKLGLRIGEVAALKWCDVDWSRKEIHIRRMEGLENDGTGKLRPLILEYTKKKSPYGNRFLRLSDYEITLLKKVKSINEEFGYSDNDFIFCDSNGRTKIREIDNCIRTQCLCTNIPVKSAHDIRRTVASEMYNQGLSLEIIRQYLGHSNIQTTRGYILNNCSKQETNELIINALSGMNGMQVLMGTQVCTQ